MGLPKKIEKWVKAHEDEAFELLKTLAAIPSPSNHEEKRAAFIKTWLETQGARGVFIDEALNVIYPLACTDDNPLYVFMAHIDVVFADTDTLPVRIEDGKIHAPGVGDDTSNVVAMLMVVKYITEHHLVPRDGKGIVFVANSGEEGLGNLKGSRRIVETYGKRIEEFLSFDGTYLSVCTRAVGSKRYGVQVTTEGGHSYGAFGNRNAIAYAASLINTLYTLKVPDIGKTTYNVGTITGGTSVNTIAQSCEFLYEYRSDEQEALQYMENHFHAAIEAYRTKGIGVGLTVKGERPCSGPVDLEVQDAMYARARDIAKEYTGIEPEKRSSSTDSNIPLSLGIPSITFGCYMGKGSHTYEEWVDIASLKPGYRIAMSLVLHHFDIRDSAQD